MGLLSRFDSAALRPPAASDAVPPPELLAWCRRDDEAFAWRPTEASAAELDALMGELDGDRRLRALGAAAGWRWRLALKLREALGLRRGSDPWDAGSATSSDALLNFLPRRPTLIVSHEPAARLTLAARAPLFRWPVRLLLRQG